MIQKFNLHTHTQFCDAKNTAEEMVVSAIKKNMGVLGFSSHSYTSFDTEPCMSVEGEKEYKAEILRLKEKYADKLKIFCGIEQDYYSDFSAKGYDFVIGSVHYVKKDGKIYTVDGGKENFLKNVQQGFSGDIYGFAEEYFSAVSNVLEKTNADIVGHFDLVTKYNIDENLFSENHERYVNAYEKALKKLCEKNAVFEINMGGIIRGYKKTPYPSEKILRRIKELGGRVTISSDCHVAENIDFGFLEAVNIAKKCGFTSIVNPATKEEFLI